METESSWLDDKEYAYIESLDRKLEIIPINKYFNPNSGYGSYKIGFGDQISVTVWGLPDIFPIINISD